jgi:hypothetical protein
MVFWRLAAERLGKAYAAGLLVQKENTADSDKSIAEFPVSFAYA